MNKKLIIIAGIAGSGKTTLARKLVSMNKGLCYIEKDTIQDVFTFKRDCDEYKKIRDVTYKIMFKIAEENLSVGNDVLLCAPFNKFNEDSIFNTFNDLKRKYNLDFKYIWCYASEDEIKRRIMKRNYVDRDKSKMNDWKKFFEEEPVLPMIEFEHLCVNTEEKIDFNKIMDYLYEITYPKDIREVERKLNG